VSRELAIKGLWEELGMSSLAKAYAKSSGELAVKGSWEELRMTSRS